jgi:orotate phosphoribosyltransferase-like protein
LSRPLVPKEATVWTPDRLLELAAMRQRGRSIQAIATTVKLSKSRASYLIKKAERLQQKANQP